MDAASAEVSARRGGFLDRFLPLGHWLGSDTAGGIELSEAKTRVICTVIGLGGFLVMGGFGSLPDGIVGTAVLLPLYAFAYLVLAYKRPGPNRARRGFALLMDTLVGTAHTYFGGGFAA